MSTTTFLSFDSIISLNDFDDIIDTSYEQDITFDGSCDAGIPFDRTHGPCTSSRNTAGPTQGPSTDLGLLPVLSFAVSEHNQESLLKESLSTQVFDEKSLSQPHTITQDEDTENGITIRETDLRGPKYEEGGFELPRTSSVAQTTQPEQTEIEKSHAKKQKEKAIAIKKLAEQRRAEVRKGRAAQRGPLSHLINREKKSDVPKETFIAWDGRLGNGKGTIVKNRTTIEERKESIYEMKWDLREKMADHFRGESKNRRKWWGRAGVWQGCSHEYDEEEGIWRRGCWEGVGDIKRVDSGG